jgi:hypothetical protein
MNFENRGQLSFARRFIEKRQLIKDFLLNRAKKTKQESVAHNIVPIALTNNATNTISNFDSP